jgi:hypothetical protein
MFRYWWLGANALQHYYQLMGLLKQPWHNYDRSYGVLEPDLPQMFC